MYVQEESSLLQDEITSLEKVSTKLEKEIQRANKMKGQYLAPSVCLYPDVSTSTNKLLSNPVKMFQRGVGGEGRYTDISFRGRGDASSPHTAETR